MRSVLLLALICGAAFAHVFYHESFDNMDSWVTSAKKADYGKFALSSGDFYGDKKINQGLKTTQDAKFYAASAPTGVITNEGKDLVVSIQVKHEQGIDCGGGYVKLLSDLEPKELNGDSEYWMMFGPDVCGYTRKVHLIFNYKGTNHLWKKEPRVPDDKFTHVYTVVVHPDNTYEFYLDEEKKESGKIEDDWTILKPKLIDDPSDSKPSDWVDQAQMDDPDDKKPEDWDNEPDTIPDPEAKQPEDWDESEDGKWEPPMIQNPKAKGEWSPKRIANPNYKGPWKAKQIPNPEFFEDKNLYMSPKPLTHVAVDVWQVKSGTIFDNIVIGDNLEEVNEIVDKTWKATKDAEKAAHDEKNKSEEKKGGDDEGAHAGHGHDDEHEEL